MDEAELIQKYRQADGRERDGLRDELIKGFVTLLKPAVREFARTDDFREALGVVGAATVEAFDTFAEMDPVPPSFAQLAIVYVRRRLRNWTEWRRMNQPHGEELQRLAKHLDDMEEQSLRHGSWDQRKMERLLARSRSIRSRMGG